MLYSGFNILPRSVVRSADFNGRSDNLDVIRLIGRYRAQSTMRKRFTQTSVRTLLIVTALSAFAVVIWLAQQSHELRVSLIGSLKEKLPLETVVEINSNGQEAAFMLAEFPIQLPHSGFYGRVWSIDFYPSSKSRHAEDKEEQRLCSVLVDSKATSSKSVRIMLSQPVPNLSCSIDWALVELRLPTDEGQSYIVMPFFDQDQREFRNQLFTPRWRLEHDGNTIYEGIMHEFGLEWHADLYELDIPRSGQLRFVAICDSGGIFPACEADLKIDRVQNKDKDTQSGQ